MPLAPFVHRWRLLAAVLLLAAAVATPVLAQGERQNVMYILMGDNYFLPASVTVRVPTTVVWINQGTTVHSVRSGTWDSGPMVPGQAFWRSFTMPGEFWFTDPMYTDDGMNGYVTVQTNPIPATRTPVGGPRVGQPQPGQAPQAPGATVQTGASPAPAVSPGPLSNTPAALSSPVPGRATAGVTGPPATGPGGAAPGGGTPAPITSPAPAVSPGPEQNTPAALSSPVPGAATSGPTGPRSVLPESLDPGALPLPEGRWLPTDDGASLPLPLLGGGLLLLGVVSGRWLKR
jgi:plastocyanin